MRPPTPSLISVIIPAKDAASTLGEQLEAVSAQQAGTPVEIIVVDDGSTDGTGELARGFADRVDVRVVRSPVSRGNGAAVAAGVAASRGDFLAICDADDVVAPGWLQGWLDVAGEADLFGGPLEGERLNDAGALAWRSLPIEDPIPVRLGFLPAPLGGNVAMWRDAWDRAGGTDPDWRRGADWEFAFRAQQRGVRLAAAPGAVVHYRYRRGLMANLRQRYRYGQTQARLFATFRDAGMPSQPAGLRRWAFTILHAYQLAGPIQVRSRYLALATQQFGRLAGSIQYRVLYL